MYRVGIATGLCLGESLLEIIHGFLRQMPISALGALRGDSVSSSVMRIAGIALWPVMLQVGAMYRNLFRGMVLLPTELSTKGWRQYPFLAEEGVPQDSRSFIP